MTLSQRIAIATAEAGLPSDQCMACERQGLPILPLRRALVPDARPGCVTTVAGSLHVSARMGLRTLRMGYLYVLLDQQVWHAYEVSEQGHLRRFNPYEPSDGLPASLPEKCVNENHDIPSAFLNIDTDRCGTAWLAFSSDTWPVSVLNAYKKGQAPAHRFEGVDLTQARNNPELLGIAMTPDNLQVDKKVFEYTQRGCSPFDSAHGFHSRWLRRFAMRGYLVNAMSRHKLENGVLAVVLDDDVRLQPGLSFTLIEHPRKDLNMHWRVTRVHHEGTQFTSLQEEAAGAQQGTRYTQAAVLVPGRTEWRPAPLPKPRIDGPQMATVVGPKGEEIYCDQWGRVKVSFPWDRESQDNEFSSCWVRVSQGWAGGSWGSMAIPRIGQDVIIQYVDADPDQPMITGRTYCGNQLPPYDLPKHKTRMTIKSQTHKGDGFNELRFEDELGKEEVFIHAQRNQVNVVGNDETTTIARNRVGQVGQDEQLTIGNNFRQDTARDHTQVIGQNSRVKIKHDLNEQVGNNRSESTGANQRVVIGNNSELVIKGAQSISVGQGVQTRTTVYQLLASERIEFRSPGGSIVMDAQGITINGLTLDLQGQTKAVAKGDGNSQSLEFTADGSNKCEVKA